MAASQSKPATGCVIDGGMAFVQPFVDLGVEARSCGDDTSLENGGAGSGGAGDFAGDCGGCGGGAARVAGVSGRVRDRVTPQV